MKPVPSFTIIAALTLAACTPMLKAKSRDTGDVGRANAVNVMSDEAGPAPLIFGDETYEGPWRAARAPLTLIRPSDDPEIQSRTATLTSEKGNTLRCEVQYSFETFEASGLCLNDATGEIFDLKVK